MRHNLAEPIWRKSSYSSANGQCLEVCDDFPGTMPVRDSKLPGGPHLVVTADTWSSFVTAVKADGFPTP
ncbi:DUF397 domain-containing protein [Streptomyces corynorhini]|uniref:DUF397 domain-containing protein n=1 Tax=Streptomyces corynorhini TaxID=2282652 RepID=A0A370AUE1_9ACTN|nr:DUF397 domain-containing protein [Streptomyces corynorhini]RDG31294.1 DUF397 domain-containing protein [Streptomyces corynorhini]